VLSLVRELVAASGPPPPDDDALIELDSLRLVQIVESLEDRLGLRIAASDVVPENFDTIARIAAFLEARR
jgi:acyl carrier protein